MTAVARVDSRVRVHLFHDGRAGQLVAGLEPFPIIDGTGYAARVPSKVDLALTFKSLIR